MMKCDTKTLKAFAHEASLITADPIAHGRVQKCFGNMLFVTGFPYPIGFLARIRSEVGNHVSAEVIAFDKSLTILVCYTQKPIVESGAIVEPIGPAQDVCVDEVLLGRVIGALGEPIDCKGALRTNRVWPLDGKSSAILQRGRVTTRLSVGVRAIDGLLAVGEGQRIALIAGSGVGKTVLMRQIIANSEVDIIVVGLVGERAREISDFVESSNEDGFAARTITVAVPANHSPILRIKAAQRATAIAEYFSAQGKTVLLMIDSLTRVAHAQREIGLAVGEPPTMKGYPPSVIALIPQLIERAGVNAHSGGSITAIYTILADGDDLDDPIVDSARAITDGHIVLSRTLAEQGVFPAVDIAKSISRVMPDIVTTEHQHAAQNFKKMWSHYEENRDLIMMGAYQTGSDALLDLAIAKRPEFLEFVAQKPGVKVNSEATIDQLIQGFGS